MERLLQNIGIPGLLLILVIALIIFGPSKLPEIGRAAGSTLKEFKKATKDLVNDEDEDGKKTEESNKLTAIDASQTKTGS